jgi:hypothetical protein
VQPALRAPGDIGGKGERGEVVDAAEAAEAFDAGAERFEREEIAQLLVDTVQPGHGVIDGAEIGTVGLLQRRQRPSLRLEPRGMAFGPRALGGGEATPVPEEEVGQPMPGAGEIGANVFATAQEVTRGLFLRGGNVDGGQGAGAIRDRELTSIAAIGFHPVPRTPWNQGRRNDIARDAVRHQCAL